MKSMRETETLDRVQFQYEAQGFSFEREPNRSELPAFFEGYVPDAIARRNGETVVIEIKAREADRAVAEQIGRVAENIRRQPGYRFQLILAEPGESSPGTLQSDEAKLAERLETARRLLAAGDTGSALMITWSAVEGLARARLGDENRGFRPPVSSRSLVEALVAFGVIEEGERGHFEALAMTRNLIAHGGTRAEVSTADVTALLGLAQRLVEPSR
jgi:sirohydrochlorin ferrochelatase